MDTSCRDLTHTLKTSKHIILCGCVLCGLMNKHRLKDSQKNYIRNQLTSTTSRILQNQRSLCSKSIPELLYPSSVPAVSSRHSKFICISTTASKYSSKQSKEKSSLGLFMGRKNPQTQEQSLQHFLKLCFIKMTPNNSLNLCNQMFTDIDYHRVEFWSMMVLWDGRVIAFGGIC